MPSMTGTARPPAHRIGHQDDPRIEGHGTMEGLSVRGPVVGDLEFQGAHRQSRVDLRRHHAVRIRPGRRCTARPQLRDPYRHRSQSQLRRLRSRAQSSSWPTSRISRSSRALSGTAQFAGPLAHPREMRGDLRLPQVAIDRRRHALQERRRPPRRARQRPRHTGSAPRHRRRHRPARAGNPRPAGHPAHRLRRQRLRQSEARRDVQSRHHGERQRRASKSRPTGRSPIPIFAAACNSRTAPSRLRTCPTASAS